MLAPSKESIITEEADWVGFDLDGTLAQYYTWGDGTIGAPIPSMVDRLKAYRAQGIEVRIVTARVSGLMASGEPDLQEAADREKRRVEDWCRQHLGEVLPVTATKDFRMAKLYDDRCVQVETNTGRLTQDHAQEIIERIRTMSADDFDFIRGRAGGSMCECGLGLSDPGDGRPHGAGFEQLRTDLARYALGLGIMNLATGPGDGD
jgi:hypothetical protein